MNKFQDAASRINTNTSMYIRTNEGQVKCTLIGVKGNKVYGEAEDGDIYWATQPENFLLVLSPMSSMADSEREYLSKLRGQKRIDWLVTNHFDYNGLIGKEEAIMSLNEYSK